MTTKVEPTVENQYRKKPVVVEAVRFVLKDKWPDCVILKDASPGIETLEGFMQLTDGDWIITGVKGEKYPCKPDIFEMTYEKVKPTIEKWRKKIEKLGNDVMRGNKIECKCPTCGDRSYGYDTEIKAKDSWIFVELSSLYERLISHITEPTHSLISKIPSAYGVGSANLPEGDNWERKFDEAFEGTMCDGTGVDYGDTQREVKDFIRTLLSQSVQEAKAEERREMLSLLTVVLTHSSMHSTHNKYCASCDLKKAIDEFLSNKSGLASLKQEEEV